MTAFWGRRVHDVSASTAEEAIARLAGQGFKTMQLAPSKSLGFTAEKLTPGFAAHLRALLDKYGMTVSVLGSYFDLNDYSAKRDETLRHYKDHLLLANWAGLKVIGTETGHIRADDPHYNDAFEAVLENVGPILEQAERLGIIFAIEPVYGHTIYDADKMEAILKRYPSDNLRVIFDPVNLISPENETKKEEVWQDFMERLGDRVVCVHVKDYDWRDGKKVDLPVGQGILDFSYVKSIQEKKPYIDYIIETLKDEQVPEVKRILGI